MVSLDWVRMGWGDQLSPQFNEKIPFAMDFSAATENDIGPLNAAINSVKRIAEEYPGPYTLMASGGVDSQAMIFAWMCSGIPFKVLSIIYEDHQGNTLNHGDLSTLKTFARANKIDVEYKIFNVIDFIENELDMYVKEYQCISPQLCTHMKLSEFCTKGTVIYSGNFYDNGPGFNYTILGLYRYAVKTGKSMIPFFFIHDKELVGAFQKFCREENIKSINNSYARKCETLRLAGFDIIPQATKLTGFELVKEHYDTKHELVSMKDRLQFAIYPSDRIFDLRFRYHFTKIVRYVEHIIITQPCRKICNS